MEDETDMPQQPTARPKIHSSRRIFVLCLVGCGSVCLTGGVALAQEVQAPETPPPPPPVVEPLAGVAEMERRIDDLDQRLRASERKAELAQQALTAERRAAPSTTVDERGLSVRSPDGNFRIAFHGLVQIDGRRLFDNVALEDRDTFLVRRLRPILDASWLGIAEARLVPDFGGGSATLLDAYIDLGPRPWLKLRAGKFKPPVGLERLQSDPEIVFNERALDANLGAQRDLGVELHGDVVGGLVRYALGVFNGAANNASSDVDGDHAKTFGGRLFLQPFVRPALKPFGKLGVGIGFTTGNETGVTTVSNGAVSGTGLGSFRTADQNTFFQYLSSTTDPSATVVAQKRHTRINPQFFYYYGPVGLLVEYIHEYQEVAKGAVTGAVNNTAAHGTLSYVYGGDASFDGVTPKHPIDLSAGHVGAIEVAMRYEWLKVDDLAFPILADPSKSARQAQSAALALSWYLSRNLRTNVNYAQTWFEGGAAMNANRTTEKVLLGRLQAAF
jgi:phosphate-selective porin OprO/OprP